MEKTWENFNNHFTMEHHLYRKQTHASQARGFHSANNAHRGLLDTLLIEQSESLVIVATASAADCGSMSDIITTNARLSSHLAKKAAALTAENETIRLLRSASRPRGGGTPPASPSSTRANTV